MSDAPNLIFVLGENHGAYMTGCYGDAAVRTPTLDKVAARGALFRNAYCSSPICVPARASIATGRFPHQTGFWCNSIAYNGSVPSWMHRLRAHGHEVSAIGKLHFRSTNDDNGFTEEIEPMHIVDGVGGLIGLLRGSGEDPVRRGNWDMYATTIGIGVTSYQEYDRRITRHAMEWLRRHGRKSARPWVLCVNYVSAHPPFLAPQPLWDLYPLASVTLPPMWRAHERPRHPAIEHLRTILGSDDDIDEQTLRRIIAGYMAVVTHLDAQIGEVLSTAEELGLLESTQVLYSSDHGDSCGSHYILGKFNMYERSARVPLIMAGPGIPTGAVVEQIVSHVDLFPTILETMGVAPDPADESLPGASLWPAIGGAEEPRVGFAEYHALGSKNASYMLRAESDKLIYHVDMPPQVFDLSSDPDEKCDLASTPAGAATILRLEAKLRAIVDPEATEIRAKADQRALAAKFGGPDAIRKRGGFAYTPVPGARPDFVEVTERDARRTR